MTAGRRVVSGLVLALVAVAAVGAAALAKVSAPPGWLAVSVAGVAFAAGLVLDPFKKLVGDWVERPSRRHGVLVAQTRMHDRRGRLRRVRDCTDPLRLGVHPAATVGDAPAAPGRIPPYVRRDAHARLREAFDAGGLVVIEGSSTAGKTRLAFEAMNTYAPDRRLVVPAGPTALAEMVKAGVVVRDAVVWLDDVESHLVSGGLDGAILDALSPVGSRDVLVLATLRAEARRELTAGGLETSVARAVEEVMRRAHVISLSGALSDDERTRAERLRSDQRIATALDQTTGAGFTEYLAAAPATLRHWESAREGENPTGGAIISAAVDARRAGWRSPIPRALLETLYGNYLDDRARDRPDRIGFDDGLAWAITPVKGASGCLTPAGEDAYEPFDYLTDHTQKTKDLKSVPPALWPVLLDAADVVDLGAIGGAAYSADQHAVSEAAFRRAAESGNAVAMNDLALVLAVAGRHGEAGEWLARAVEAGEPKAMHNRGVYLEAEGRPEEAARWYRRAADAGNPGAMTNLGNFFNERGQREEAERWFRRAAGLGQSEAMHNLGNTLAASDRREEAVGWYRRAVDAGCTDAMLNLGVALYELGRNREAEDWYRRAVDAGQTAAMNNLANVLRITGRREEAELWYRRAIDAGDDVAEGNLASMLEEPGGTGGEE